MRTASEPASVSRADGSVRRYFTMSATSAAFGLVMSHARLTSSTSVARALPIAAATRSGKIVQPGHEVTLAFESPRMVSRAPYDASAEGLAGSEEAWSPG